MKKILCMIIACMLCYTQVGAVVLLGAGVSAGAPTYSFNIEFDSDTDWSDGYTIGGNDYSAGDQTGTLSSTTHFKQSSTYSVSGSYSATTTAGIPAYVAFDVSSADIVDTDVGYVRAYVWTPTTWTGSGFYFSVRPGSNRLDFKVYVDHTVTAEYRGGDGSNIVYNTSTDTVNLDAWTRVDIRWSVANNDLDVRIGTGSWKTLNSAMTTFDTAPGAGDLKLGTAPSSALESFYNDNITIWKNFTGPGD